MNRTVLPSLAVSLALAGALSGVVAQDFPNKPVKLLIGYPPAGAPDTIARALAPSVSATLGQSFVIENRPGAGGATAVLEAARAAPDGYTLLSADSAQWAIIPAMRSGAYDWEKSFAPVAQISTNSIYILVRSSLGVSNFKEFVALVKSRPGELNYGSSGNGTIHHLYMESVKSAAGLNLAHVPYKGGVQMVQALLSGDIPIGIAGATTTAAHVKAGVLRYLVTSTRERSKLTPDVPGMGEVGLGEINIGGDVGYFVPLGTPRAIIDRLSAAIAKAIPDLAPRAPALGVEPTYRNPDQLGELVRADIAMFTKAVKLAGVKVD